MYQILIIYDKLSNAEIYATSNDLKVLEEMLKNIKTNLTVCIYDKQKQELRQYANN
jgi:hypothetical protein